MLLSGSNTPTTYYFVLSEAKNMSYHQFTNESGEQYGSFETFYYYDAMPNTSHRIGDRGWYWNACFPGCLPDGEPSGPFPNEQEAIKDATEFV